MNETFALLREWAPLLWSVESVVCLLLCGRIWRTFSEAMVGQDGKGERLLASFRAVAIAASVLYVVLTLIGVISLATRNSPNPVFGGLVLILLLLVPVFVLWLLNRVFRMVLP